MNALTFILHHYHLLFALSMLSHSHKKNYFEATLLVVETTVIIIKSSQVVYFKLILSFWSLYINNTLHALIINCYIYLPCYFTVCELQVISCIVASIQLTIIWNSKVIEVVCFELILFLYNSTHSTLSMHSHSYFITHIYYLHFRFYHITTIFFLWRGKHRKTSHHEELLAVVRKEDLLF